VEEKVLNDSLYQNPQIYAELPSPNGEFPNRRNMSMTNFPTNPLIQGYNQTITYLRSSHASPETRRLSLDDTLPADEPEIRKFGQALASEVAKLNKLKLQKQREAKDNFEIELKRIQLIEELKEREQKKK